MIWDVLMFMWYNHADICWQYQAVYFIEKSYVWEQKSKTVYHPGDYDMMLDKRQFI